MSNKLSCPFEINQGIGTLLTDMDPDIQFYSDSHYIKNLNCEYHLLEKLKIEIKDCSTTGTFVPLFTS